MLKKLPVCFLFSSILIFLTISQTFAQSSPYILAYWGNWHVWDQNKNGRDEDVYQIPGSINKETRATVVNPLLQKQLQHLTAIAYAFLEVYPDAGMWREVPQKPINAQEIGKIYWSDPWTDLFNDASTASFCKSNVTTCYFAYEIEKDPNQKRAAVDINQPWNYFYMGNFDAFTHLPNIKHFISIGGWYHQDSFEKGAFVNPHNFNQSLIAIIKRTEREGGRIDGIDLDYEPPNGYTKENALKLAELTQDLRNALNQANLSHVMISAAVFASPEKIANFGADNWKKFASALDYIGVMGYDFHGAWDNPALTGLHSNLYEDPSNPNKNDFSGIKAVNALIAAGVPKEKLILGLPSYGRVVGGVSSTLNNGLYQAFDPNRVVQEDLDKGQVSYLKIAHDWLKNDFTEYHFLHENKVGGVWAYNPKQQQFVSYDNCAIVDSKADYVLTNGLGGMMMWELISDLSPDEPDALLKHMHAGLNK